jgi:hypothetical protein
VCRMNDLALSVRRSILPNGAPYWRASQGRAYAVQDALYTMFSNVAQRKAARAKALKREQIKNVAPPEVKKGKPSTIVGIMML